MSNKWTGKYAQVYLTSRPSVVSSEDNLWLFGGVICQVNCPLPEFMARQIIIAVIFKKVIIFHYCFSVDPAPWSTHAR